jgi:hypothetical protein
MVYGVQAKQISVSGLITGSRAYFRKTLIFHSGTPDIIIEFYDRATAPTGGEPHYDFHVYGKGEHELDMPDTGILFKTGIYVVVPANTIVTVFYEDA